MSQMKRFAEQVSVDMGKDGEIDDEVLVEAQRRLDFMSQELDDEQSSSSTGDSSQ